MATMADKTIKDATRLRKIELSTREIIRICDRNLSLGHKALVKATILRVRTSNQFSVLSKAIPIIASSLTLRMFGHDEELCVPRWIREQ